MRRITPHLWFETHARDAAQFYTTVFRDATITDISTIRDTPSGECDIVSFEIANQPFVAINAGPEFTPNPSISFFVNFDPAYDENARENLEATWKRLEEEGTILMPLDTYPFSERYGWIQDKYGISWQLILTDPEGEDRPYIVPSLLFTGSVCGRAEEATEYYLSIFDETKRGLTARYPEGSEPDKEGTIMYTDLMLNGQWFAAMDSAQDHAFEFNEGISLLIPCETQDEIDRYWNALSADPRAEQCGWLKDRYGVSWQVWPTALSDMIREGTTEQVDRVTQAFLQMKKFDISELERAYETNKHL